MRGESQSCCACVRGRGEREQPGSDGDSLALRVPTDGDAACGHSHLAGKVLRTKAEPGSTNRQISDVGLTLGPMNLTRIYHQTRHLFAPCENEASITTKLLV